MDKILTKKQLSKALNVHFNTVDNMVKRGMPYISTGGHKRFNIDDVLKWMRAKANEKN